MGVYIYLVFTLLCLILIYISFYLLQLNQNIEILIVAITALGIFYDNLIICIGSYLKEGKLLKRLSFPRFIAHSVITPLLIVVVQAMQSKASLPMATAWLISTILILFDVITYYRVFSLDVIWWQNTLRYTNIGNKLPPISSIIVTLIAAMIGFQIWQTFNIPWLFFGSLVMFIGGAIPQSIAGGSLCSGAEIIFIASFLATIAQKYEL